MTAVLEIHSRQLRLNQESAGLPCMGDRRFLIFQPLVASVGLPLAEDVLDAALVELVLAVDALGVDVEQDGDAVSGPLGDLSRGDARAEAGGDAGVAEVVDAAGER